MPIKTQSDLPAKEILERENIFVMDENRAMHQDIRPINIVILNLMPLKEDTELQILRSLSNTPLQVDVSFMAPASHASTHTSKSHLNQFYQTFDEIRQKYFDGLIITGAPVEQMEYEEVDYWEEVCKIMEWSKKHVTSTLHLCWGAQAGLYYHYGIPKYDLSQKKFGVFRHRVMNRKIPLVPGFDDHTVLCRLTDCCHGSLLLLRFLHHMYHFLQRTILSHLRCADVNGTEPIDRPTDNCFSYPFINGNQSLEERLAHILYHLRENRLNLTSVNNKEFQV